MTTTIMRNCSMRTTCICPSVFVLFAEVMSIVRRFAPSRTNIRFVEHLRNSGRVDAQGDVHPSFYARAGSALAQYLLPIAAQGRQEIIQDRALAGLDLDSDGHAGGEADHAVLDLHLA